MRDIKDSASPFAGQYAAWDEWIYSGALASVGRRAIYSAQDGAQNYTAVVTADGYVRPQLAELRDGLMRISGELPESTEHCVNQISYYGVMDAALKEQLEAERSRIWAAAYPRIPQWLADAPALRNMVLPSGEVVTLGELGSGQPQPAGAAPKPQAYYRYSAEGKLLGQTLVGEMWQALYVPDWTATILLEQLKAQRLPKVTRGCTVFENRETHEIGAIYRYDGAPVDIAAGVASQPPALLTEITAKQVQSIAAVQGDAR